MVLSGALRRFAGGYACLCSGCSGADLLGLLPDGRCAFCDYWQLSAEMPPELYDWYQAAMDTE